MILAKIYVCMALAMICAWITTLILEHIQDYNDTKYLERKYREQLNALEYTMRKRREERKLMEQKKEMTAVEYLKSKQRMCDSIQDCSKCTMPFECDDYELNNPEIAVEKVREWCEEHPAVTNLEHLMSVIREEFVGVKVVEENGVISFNKSPQWWNQEYKGTE